MKEEHRVSSARSRPTRLVVPWRIWQRDVIRTRLRGLVAGSDNS